MTNKYLPLHMAKLEQEIQQSSFANASQRAWVNFLFTYNWLDAKLKPIFKHHGITGQQYNVLRILRGRYPNCAAAHEIKQVMIDKSPDLTRLLDRLQKKGLIDRRLNEESRRKMDIQITKAGLELLEQIGLYNKELFEQVFGNIPEDKLKTFDEVLDLMRE